MKKGTAIYLVSNFAGLALFLWFVLRIESLAHAEQRDYRDASDSFTFLATAVPVFLVCAAYSCFWGIWGLVEAFRARRFESLKALVAVVCAWTALLVTLRKLT